MKDLNKYLQENGKYYNMYNEKGNPATVGVGMYRQMLRAGYTFEEPVQVVYYKPDGTGFYTAPSAKWWADKAKAKGYTGVASIEEFAPVLEIVKDGGQVGPVELKEFIDSLNK